MIKKIEDVSCAFMQDIDLVCFSHLRWGFVFQRPQHLMSRFARHSRVFFFEEPVFEGESFELRCSVCPRTGVRVMTPVLPAKRSEERRVGKECRARWWL